MTDRVSRGAVVAFRLGANHLIERVGETGLLDAAGRCGIQNSPPGSALLALHARVRDLTPEQMADAVAEERSLLQTWCMRGAPFYFPAADAPVFTTGVLPPTEAALRHFVLGVGPALDTLGMRLTEAAELTGAEIRAVLSGRRFAINELGAAIARRIARRLPHLLPPRDPYTELRDRETIVDERYHRDVWKPVGEPGTVLADGEIAGIWRPRKRGRKLTLTVTTFGSLPDRHRKSLLNEAEQVAPLRGASSVDVEFDAC